MALSDSSYKTGIGTPHERCLEIHQYGRFSINVKRALRLPLSSGWILIFFKHSYNIKKYHRKQNNAFKNK